MKRIPFLFLLLLLPAVTWPTVATAEEHVARVEINGRPLDYWASRVDGELSYAELTETVDALAAAMSLEENETRVTAADALAVLGPQAKGAIDALLAQLGHETPWVRVASMAALASIGEEAVPALIDTFVNQTGGPSVRAAFVLGSIGPDAKPALPALEAAYREATPVMQDRLLGILRSIAPQQYDALRAPDNAVFDPHEAIDPLAADAAARGDWPEFHGPRRDAICREQSLLTAWPDGGPDLLWKLEGLGRGYSTVSIAGGTLYTMGDLPTAGGEEAQYVFATTAYSTGAALLKIEREGDAFTAREVYFVSPRDFQNHHGGVVLVGDHLYGGHGPNRGDPACVDFATGEIIWKERSPARGSAGVLYADGHLIFRYDRGEVVLIKATPEGLQIQGQFTAMVDEGPAWAHPVIHNGRLLLRHANILGCYDLRAVQ